MDFSESDDVIGQLLAEFMADQKSRLRRESHLRYAGIIELLDDYLDRYYRPEYWRWVYDASALSQGRFRGLPPAVDLVRRFSVFLGDYLPRETENDAERLRAARKVIKALAAWLTAKGYIADSKPARRRAKRSERTPYLPGFLQH